MVTQARTKYVSFTAVNGRGYSFGFGPHTVRLKLREMFFRPTTKSL